MPRSLSEAARRPFDALKARRGTKSHPLDEGWRGLHKWLSRHAPSPLIWMPLEEELAPVLKFLRGRVLNAGCGSRDIAPLLRAHGAKSVESCDILSYSFPGFFQCDLTHIPRDDESYDAVLCNAVLEHVRDPEAVVAELMRVLKPRGHLVVGMPFLQPYHADPVDFTRYTRRGLEALAERHGAQVLFIQALHGPGHVGAWLLWAFLREQERHWTRLALWYPIRVWTQATRPVPSDNDNASSFQAVFRKV